MVEVPPDVEGSLNAIKSAITSVNKFILRPPRPWKSRAS